VLLEEAPAMSGVLAAACRLIWRSTCPDDLEMVLLSKDAVEVIAGCSAPDFNSLIFDIFI
jgi:hypothetical protein